MKTSPNLPDPSFLPRLNWFICIEVSSFKKDLALVKVVAVDMVSV